MKQSLFLIEMRKLLSDNSVTLQEIATELRSKGLVFLALISVLPFMQPIPIPGLSSILGFVILLQGVGLIVADKPLLTEKMKAISLSPDKVRRFVNGAEKIFPYIGWLVRSRGENLARHRVTHIICGCCLVFLSAFLALPLPIPSSNFLPAIGIFFICLGLLEDDFLLILLGIFYSVIFAWMLSYLSHFIVSEVGESDLWLKFFGN